MVHTLRKTLDQTPPSLQFYAYPSAQRCRHAQSPRSELRVCHYAFFYPGCRGHPLHQEAKPRVDCEIERQPLGRSSVSVRPSIDRRSAEVSGFSHSVAWRTVEPSSRSIGSAGRCRYSRSSTQLRLPMTDLVALYNAEL